MLTFVQKMLITLLVIKEKERTKKTLSEMLCLENTPLSLFFLSLSKFLLFSLSFSLFLLSPSLLFSLSLSVSFNLSAPYSSSLPPTFLSPSFVVYFDQLSGAGGKKMQNFLHSPI